MDIGFSEDKPVILVERDRRKKLVDGFHHAKAAKEVCRLKVRK
jgi:hypothetical protein